MVLAFITSERSCAKMLGKLAAHVQCSIHNGMVHGLTIDAMESNVCLHPLPILTQQLHSMTYDTVIAGTWSPDSVFSQALYKNAASLSVYTD